MPTSSGAGSPAYAYLRAGSVPTGEAGRIWAALPYTSVSLERQACYGTCPVYTVEFTRGAGEEAGGAVYEGNMYVDKIGVYAGQVDIFDYGQLCQLLDELGFRNFDESYAAAWTDDSTVIVQAATEEGTHRVQDYGRQGPPELFALQLAIDAMANRIEWTER